MRLRPDLWLIGIPALAGIWAAAAFWIAPEIEGTLRRQVQAVPVAETEALRGIGAKIEVDGRDLSITSDLPLSGESRVQAERLLAALPPLRGVAYHVLPPVEVSPFQFSVRRTDEGLVLGGYVPPGAIRTTILAEARNGGSSVRDDLRSAAGAPPGFEDAARFLLKAAPLLEGGAASLSDRKLSLAGEAPDSASYREVRALLSAPPPGFTITAAKVEPPLARPFTWGAALDSGRISLSGHVPSEEARRALVSLVPRSGRDLRIEDRMETARGIEAGIQFDQLVRQMLALLGELEDGRVELAGRQLSIRGRLAAKDLIGKMQTDLRASRFAGVELREVLIEPVVPRPYRFRARREEDRLHLSGFLPGETERSAIRELAKRRFPFDPLVDELHVADGAPEGVASAVRLGLERLSSLASGELAVEDRNIRLAGRSLYRELAARTERDFPREAPAGWKAIADVTHAGPEKPLDPDFCADLVSDVVRRDSVQFESGKPELSAAGRKPLAAVADVVRRCAPVRLTAVVTVETQGDLDEARQLAEGRANAVASVLKEQGIATELKPLAAKIAEGGKPAERVEFEVQP